LIVLFLLAAGGVAAAPAVAERLSDQDAQQQTPLDQSAIATPVTVAPATTVAVTFHTAPPSAPNSTVAVVLAVPFDAAAIEAKMEALAECRSEERTVFASLQGFVYETGAHPEHPDALAAIGWLEAHPDGWNARWAFQYSDGGIHVVPTSGGSCDI
jgi:hypothetical protein